jgi:hypothetical protein
MIIIESKNIKEYNCENIIWLEKIIILKGKDFYKILGAERGVNEKELRKHIVISQ